MIIQPRLNKDDASFGSAFNFVIRRANKNIFDYSWKIHTSGSVLGVWQENDTHTHYRQEALQRTVKKTRAGPTGSFTQLYWRLCINTHATFKCKPKWTQVQPNLETPVMSSCKDVWIIFTKEVPKRQNHPPVFKKYSLPDKEHRQDFAN